MVLLNCLWLTKYWIFNFTNLQPLWAAERLCLSILLKNYLNLELISSHNYNVFFRISQVQWQRNNIRTYSNSGSPTSSCVASIEFDSQACLLKSNKRPLTDFEEWNCGMISSGLSQNIYRDHATASQDRLCRTKPFNSYSYRLEIWLER